MVANHSQKARARMLMAQMPGLSLTEAKRIVAAHAAGFKPASKLSITDQLVVERAAALLASGRDLIVFGTVASGKTSGFRAILEASDLRTILIATNAWEAKQKIGGLVTVIDATSMSFQHSGLGTELNKMKAQVLALDELSSSYFSLANAIAGGPVKAITVHAPSAGSALDRIKWISPELNLQNPFFVEAIYDPQANPKRSLRLHETVDSWRSIESDHFSSSTLLDEEVHRVKRAEISVDRGGFRTILGASNDPEEILALTRWAQSTIVERSNQPDDGGSPVTVTIFEDIRGNTSRQDDTPSATQRELKENLKSIAQNGRAVNVGIALKPSANALELAAKALREGRDLLVFGTVRSGRSTALETVLMAAAIPRTLFLQMDGEYENSELRVEELFSYVVGTENARTVAMRKRGEFEVVGYDEVRSVEPDISELLRSASQRAVAVHASSSEEALRKLDQAEVELKNPVVLHCAQVNNGLERGLIYRYED